MPFNPPSSSLPLPEVPDSISVERFLLDEKYGRAAFSSARPPFTCALTGTSYSVAEVKQRVDYLSRALSHELGFKPHEGTEWDKVVGCFSMNSIDYMTLAWAVHRLGGILSCVNAAYNASELEYQMKHSGAKAIFTCLPLLKTCKEGIKSSQIPDDKVFLLPLPPLVTQGISNPGHKDINDLIASGSKLPSVPASDEKWSKGEGARRTCFLCYSSGTSGMPKGVMISHQNVIANIMQIVLHERPSREARARNLGVDAYSENALGLLPMSHIYGLIVISLVGPYRGDGVIVLPKYELKILLQAVQDFKMQILYLVPPMIIHITKSPDVVKQYDLSSVYAAFTGAAPLGKETSNDLNRIFPDWAVRQGYGLTETCTVVCSTLPDDIWLGSSGSLLPGIQVRLLTVEGNEITGYQQPGELCVRSPSVTLGYLKNEQATKETFVELSDGRYMRTGDEAIIDKSPNGQEHIFITDRIKE